MLASGGIFFARSGDPWVLAGAAVHVSFIGQDDGSDAAHQLDGVAAGRINANLTTGIDLTTAKRLPANLGTAFMGVVALGPFDLDPVTARRFLQAPNPHGRPNTDVVRPMLNGLDLTRRPRERWIIDFTGLSEQAAALYEMPYAYALEHVQPMRVAAKSSVREPRWWLFVWPRPEMRTALEGLSRFIATPLTSKHRFFVWVPAGTVANHAVGVIARDDDYTFGVLQSRVHETWSLAVGSQLETRPRYTPSTCFETFPFPDPTPEQRAMVGEAARHLVELRDGWLNPPGLAPADLARRTLTNLYNQRPTWLANAHADLDTGVLGAYGWPSTLADAGILERLLGLNLMTGAL